jgi:ubiquinone/menaquinone biosynthesis C-methylase UbiE
MSMDEKYIPGEVMKHANYQRISQNYDDNEVRQQVSKDTLLERTLSQRIITENTSPQLRLLDLACGTGTYLKVQHDAFPNAPITWYGFDASDAMMAIARQKAPFVTYAHGSAEALPYEDNFFDFISCNFAFHHFPEKAQSLSEIHRIVKEGGQVKIVNIAPEDMEDWWLYAYFPQCVEIDRERFWTYKQIYQELESLGFAVKCTMTKTLSRVSIEFVQRQAAPREISQLDLLDDADFQQGFQRIERDIENSVETIIDETALIEIVGHKLS